MNTFYIPSSSFSGIIERNPYVDSDISIIDILCKYNKSLYDKLLEKYHEDKDLHKSNVKLIKQEFPKEFTEIYSKNSCYSEQYEKLQQNEKIKKFIESVQKEEVEYTDIEKELHKLEKISISEKNTKKLEDFKNTKKENEKLVENIVASSSTENINKNLCLVEPAIQSIIIMQRGTFQENNAIKKLKDKFENNNIKIDLSHIYRNVKIDKLNIKIGGRVDCYLYDNDKKIGVIEIKTRKNGFFGKKKIQELKYELDQLTCYWYITKLNIFYICEFYNNEIMLHKFSYEDMLENWKSLQPNFEKSCKKIIDIINCKNMKKIFTQLKKYCNI